MLTQVILIYKLLQFTVTHFDLSAYLYSLPGKCHVLWIISGLLAPFLQPYLFV